MCQLASRCNHAGKSIKTSLYWAMKNCGGDAECLRQLITNISKHYQVYIATCYCTRGAITFQTFQGYTCAMSLLFTLSSSWVSSKKADSHWSPGNWSPWEHLTTGQHLSLCRVVLQGKYVCWIGGAITTYGELSFPSVVILSGLSRSITNSWYISPNVSTFALPPLWCELTWLYSIG